ncbi:MAG: addiction module protein [Burkholderiales bacterium]
MSKLSKDIMTAVFRLPATERAALVDALLQSLDKPDPEIEALWAKEAEERLAAYDRGEIEAIDAEEVFAEIRERLKK